jgi:AraC family transcriptional regulator
MTTATGASSATSQDLRRAGSALWVPSLLASVPDPWGPKFEAQGGAATLTRTGPNEIRFTAPADMALVMLSPQPNREVALNSDRKSRFLAPAGAIEIVPAGAELFARWTTAKENLLVAIAPERLRRLAELEFQSADVEFQPAKVGFVDEKAHLLAEMIRGEFRNGNPVNELYLDALIIALSTHILRAFSSLGSQPRHVYRGGLLSSVWNRLNDYIHAGLAGKLSIEEMAHVAGLSPSQFARAFRETTGQSPHQYVLSVRLAYAEHMITSTDMPLPMIAERSGFASHSHMSATIRRFWSTTPKNLRWGRQEVRRRFDLGGVCPDGTSEPAP